MHLYCMARLTTLFRGFVSLGAPPRDALPLNARKQRSPRGAEAVPGYGTDGTAPSLLDVFVDRMPALDALGAMGCGSRGSDSGDGSAVAGVARSSVSARTAGNL
jgi:hypothetical protein